MNPAASRSASSQSDWTSNGGNSLGPMGSTLSVGDYDKLLMDTKRLMSTHQLPYVAKLTTDESGEDSDRTNITSSNTWNGSSNDVSIKSSGPGQCITPIPAGTEVKNDNSATRTDNQNSTLSVNQHPKSPQPKSSEPHSSKAGSFNSPTSQQSTKVQSDIKVTNQLPPLSPPSVKKPVGQKIENTYETSQAKALMVNGTKYQPTNNPSGAQQRPSFLTNFPRPSSTCGSSPVPYSKVSSKTSPLSSSPKPYSPNLFRPIANSSPFSSSSTPSRNQCTPSPKIPENSESTSSVASPIKSCTEPETSTYPGIPLKSRESEKIMATTNQNHEQKLQTEDKMRENRKDLSNLLSEVDERIRFSLDIHSSQIPSNNASIYEATKKKSTYSTDIPGDQAAKNMKEDLSKVRKDISELKNELTVTKQGLETGKQPLLVRKIYLIKGTAEYFPCWVI